MPTSFELYNHNICVKEYPEPTDSDKGGVCDFASNEIRLYTHECGPSVVSHTFHHELVHLLLYYAGRSDLSDDETLVDTLGGLLAQYEATKR